MGAWIRLLVMRYAIVIEKAKANYSAYVPDLPGCIATGPSGSMSTPKRWPGRACPAMTTVSLLVTPTKVGVQLCYQKHEAGFRLSPE